MKGLNIANGFSPGLDIEAACDDLAIKRVFNTRFHLTQYIRGNDVDRSFGEILDLLHSRGIQTIPTVPNTLNDKDVITFWGNFLSHYADHPAVYAIDLINEPHSTLRYRWPELSKFLVQLVRRYTEKPIVIGQYDLMQFECVDYENVIYSHHHYAPHGYTHQGINGIPVCHDAYPGLVAFNHWVWAPRIWNAQSLEDYFAPLVKLRQRGMRIMIGEFSVTSDAIGGDRWIEDSINVFNKYGFDWYWHMYFGQSSGFDKWKTRDSILNKLF